MVRDIILISPKFSNHIGGMETHGYEFAKVFVKDQEFPLKSIYTKSNVMDGVIAPCFEEQDGISSSNTASKELEKIIASNLTGNFNIDAEVILNYSNIDSAIFYLNSPTWLPAIKIIKEINPSIKIIIRSGGNDIIAGWIGDETNITESLENTRYRLVNMVNDYVDYFIVNSNYSFERSLSVGINNKKMVVITGGVDCEVFHPLKKLSNDIINILTTCRLVKFKGIEHSLNTLRLLVDQGVHNFKYNIVGDGPEKKNILNLISLLSLDKYVTLHGAKRIEDMPKYFQMADIYLHLPILLQKYERNSSYIHTETMGRSLCEASASGLPIVTSAVGGIPEVVINKKTGYLVPENDHITACETLKELIANTALREQISQNGRTFAKENFDWKNIWPIYKYLFRGVKP